MAEVICEIMKLRPEKVNDYIALHNDTWPELVQALRRSGFIEEYIYMLDNLVMVIMKCEKFEDSKVKLAETDIFQKWTCLVREMLLEDQAFFHTSDVLLDLSPIWRLDSFNEQGIYDSNFK